MSGATLDCHEGRPPRCPRETRWLGARVPSLASDLGAPSFPTGLTPYEHVLAVLMLIPNISAYPPNQLSGRLHVQGSFIPL